MLDHPKPWQGMVFGMRARWSWGGAPRNIWKIEDFQSEAVFAPEAGIPVETNKSWQLIADETPRG